MRTLNLHFSFEDKDYGPRTVKDLRLISAKKILENNRTVGECQSPLCDLPGGVTTMHVVVQPPSVEKGLALLFTIFTLKVCQKSVLLLYSIYNLKM